MLSRLFILIAMLPTGALAEPELFAPGSISRPETHEALNWLSADGETAMFTRSHADWSNTNIYIGQMIEGDWSIGRASFSTGANDAGASVALDLSALLFSSNRPIGADPGGDTNLWSVAINDQDSWSFEAPRPLPSPVNSSSEECCAVFLSEDRFLFASDRTGDWDVYQAIREQDEWRVEALPQAFGSPRGEWPSWVSGDGKLMLLSSMREGGLGKDDIYVSILGNSGWRKPCGLPAPINSANYEDNPALFGDRLYWSSRRLANGQPAATANIFSIPSTEARIPSDLIHCQD
jgi:hypothetical protein